MMQLRIVDNDDLITKYWQAMERENTTYMLENQNVMDNVRARTERTNVVRDNLQHFLQLYCHNFFAYCFPTWTCYRFFLLSRRDYIVADCFPVPGLRMSPRSVYAWLIALLLHCLSDNFQQPSNHHFSLKRHIVTSVYLCITNLFACSSYSWRYLPFDDGAHVG